MTRYSFLPPPACIGALLASGCSLGTPKADGTYVHERCMSSADPVELSAGEEYGVWNAVTLPDAECADGSPYKFFVQYQPGATDLTISFQPGGACWDYDSCSYRNGVLNAVNLDNENGLDDHFMTRLDAAATEQLARYNFTPDRFGFHPASSEYPRAEPWWALYTHLGKVDESVATNLYNHVFFPYCTGDVYVGDVTRHYRSATGEGKVIRHRGRRNIELATRWLEQKFPADSTGQLVVIGGSAGGLGAQIHYGPLRDALAPHCSALVNDSAPLFAPGGEQESMRQFVSEIWNTSELQAALDERLSTHALAAGQAPAPGKVSEDFAHLNHALARAYPDDRFLLSAFRKDLTFSTFSYAVQGAADDAEGYVETWQRELDEFMAWVDPLPNFGYYFADFRDDNCSHLLTMPPLNESSVASYVRHALVGGADGYLRTEIDAEVEVLDETGSPVRRPLHFGDALRQLLDLDQPIPRYDAADSGQWFSSERAQACTRLQ